MPPSLGTEGKPQGRSILSGVGRGLRVAGKPLEWVLILAVRLYQLCISPLLPRTCRFHPSCSRYMIEALRQNGPVVGLLQGLWRIVRCNPLCEGGYDPVRSRDKPEETDAPVE